MQQADVAGLLLQDHPSGLGQIVGLVEHLITVAGSAM